MGGSPILILPIVNDPKPEGSESKRRMQSSELVAVTLFSLFVLWRSARWLRDWRRGNPNPRGLLFLGMGWVLLISYGNQHFS